MSDKDYSLDALNRFFDYAAIKGILKRNTAQSRKLAANKILSILEAHEKTDLRLIDIESVFDRFQNLQSTDYKPESLQVYLSRLRTALSDFFSYVGNPSSFKPASNQQRSRSKSSNGNNTKKQGTDSVEDNSTEKVVRAITHHDIEHIVVPVPLREGLTIKISNLPADLTVSEANRLAAIIKAFAVQEGG
ncbi:hypothetical protein [Thiothrix unzii]|uniref:Core-binding (CB) domain-containing protein n=1 Tax=Thiothrix unzii TaxID=111769 RepID=A0A975F6Y3_9GAMM|nr:hypothetical protein [Thiothrix unzii]QTR52044.1 hypothetical protein J9260_09775 [Thiothrix unzii]